MRPSTPPLSHSGWSEPLGQQQPQPYPAMRHRPRTGHVGFGHRGLARESCQVVTTRLGDFRRAGSADTACIFEIATHSTSSNRFHLSWPARPATREYSIVCQAAERVYYNIKIAYYATCLRDDKFNTNYAILFL